MKKKPLILVTNDDSIYAKGIASLIDAVKDLGDILVVAPEKPQSGMGHAITVNKPLRLRKSDRYKGVEAYTCSGTPVDCVKLAIYEVLHKRPDIIVSGINHGANYATNVLYSGTMSAAVEGALEGIPSIGFSLLDHDPDADFDASKYYAQRITNEVLKNGMTKGVCLNVNIPKLPITEISGIRVCRQARAYWEDKFDKRQDPFGQDYYWLTGKFENYDGGEDTDVYAIEENYVSVVPTQFDMTAHHAIAEINQWDI